MKTIAHRGANKEAFENSYAAYELAIKIGADRLELDVLLSKNNEIYIAHDDNLKRVTGKTVKLSELTSQEVENIQLLNGEKIPTLEKVISKYLSQIEINIELKGENLLLSKKVAELISNFDQNQIILSSFNPELLAETKKFAPDYARALLVESPRNMKKLSEYVETMKRIESTIFHPQDTWVDEKFDDVLNVLTKQFGYQKLRIFPWVAMIGEDQDKIALWDRVCREGIDGLCTNYIREFIAYLN